MAEALLWAVAGTGFTFSMTALGAAMVFLFRRTMSGKVQKVFLGFAAGVMIAASVWSLLIPAIEEAEAGGQTGWLAAAGGFILGIVFLYVLDRLIPHLHPGMKKTEGISSSMKRTSLLVMAVTLHNIPEGMAVGLSFALAAQHAGNPAAYASAMALAAGIGIQNFPEGAAISLPLRQEGMGLGKAFFSGQHVGHRRAGFRRIDGAGRRRYFRLYALAAVVCGRSHDVRGGGGADTGGASWRAFPRGHDGRDGRLFADDGAGRRARLV